MAALDSQAELYNGAFSGNVANQGGGLFALNDQIVLTSATFSRNEALDGGAIFAEGDTEILLRNSILWANGWPEIESDEWAQVFAERSIIRGGYPGDAILDSDPQFFDADGPDDVPGNDDDDLRLQAESPAVDLGDRDLLPADWHDLDGDGDSGEPLSHDVTRRARVSGDQLDVGAYEYQIFYVLPSCSRRCNWLRAANKSGLLQASIGLSIHYLMVRLIRQPPLA
jgi:predicted outer membrane repeat protein